MVRLKRISIFLLSLSLLIVIIWLFVNSIQKNNNKTSDELYYEAYRRFDKIFSIKIPGKMNFCGETVPVDKFYVRESLDRELLVNTYWHSNTLLMFKRAYRYFPVIDSILKLNHVPSDFRYLALIESGFENIVSPAGAKGFWQIMKTTAQMYGLEVNAEIDERYHLEKSTLAACKYLKASYQKFGNWTLAAASYNMGAEGLASVIKSQKSDNYYDLYLNKETQRYIYRILAVKLIYESPVAYGFYLREKDFYPEIKTYTVIVDTSITNWAEFAIINKSNYRILKEFNPWILKYSLTNKNKKTYNIKFPVVGYESLPLFKIESSPDDNLFNDTLKINEIH